MMLYSNEFPTGTNMGPTRAMPKRMGAAMGEAARLKRKDNKKAAVLRYKAKEKKFQK